MDIAKAQKLQMGDTVHCPADRGTPAYTGRVASTPHGSVHLNWLGEPFIWVVVVDTSGAKAVWSSNRLG